MYLYFEHSDGRMSLVSDRANEENALSLIQEDVHKRNPKYKIYYFRRTKLTDGICYDVGSHVEFYWLMSEKCKEEERKIIYQ